MMPPILYKYCDLRGIDILKSRRIKVTPFNGFNDPFEVAPRMRPDFRIEDAVLAVTDPEFILGLYRTTTLYDPYKEYDAFAAVVHQHKDELAAKAVEDYARNAADFRETHRDRVSADFGLICLSATSSDILMWAHYTKGHSGFIVGLDTSKAFFADGPPVYDVEYGTERVLMGHYYDRRDNQTETIKRLLKRKSLHWAYEHEWRQLRQLSKCDPVPDPVAPGQKHFFASLPSETIAEVILGCRCPSSELIEVLNDRAFEHVRVKQAHMHESDFELVFAPCARSGGRVVPN